MHPTIVEEKIRILPEDPGCYLMKDETGLIIYVGKAKNLKNRVRSYFTGAHPIKVQRMVEQIADFELMITKNEAEALILENQLIKSHQPRYNILLKDDKSYPFIAITKEQHPRIILTREPKKAYRFLAGPYTSGMEARNVIEILNYLYPLRKCVRMPKEFCLYYHIGQCIGPCEIDFPDDIYDEYIKDIMDFLRGKQTKIKTVLTTKMNDASEKLEFEQAGIYKKMLDSIRDIYDSKGTYPNIKVDTDVVGYAIDHELIAVQIFHVRDGSVVARESDVFVYEADNPLDGIESYIYQFYQSKRVVLPKEIFISDELNLKNLEENYTNVKFMTPQRGNKKHLFDFAVENAQNALSQKSLLAQHEYDKTIGATVELGDLLNMPAPHTIEMIDTANLGNENIVSAAVVFTNGKPDRNQYRKYSIRSIQKQDDYQALREVVYRRLYRQTMEQSRISDLLIVDGGVGHVNVAKEVVATFNVDLKVIGLSKDASHRTEAIVLEDGTQLKLKVTSNLYKLLGFIQEEVHRFAIDYHRQKRMKTSFSSQLTKIPGVGEARRSELLKHFGTIDRIENASSEELARVVPEAVAENIYRFFEDKRSES